MTKHFPQRFLALLLAAVCLLALTACSSSASSSAPAGSSASQAQSAPDSGTAGSEPAQDPEAEKTGGAGNIWPNGVLPPLPDDGIERTVIEVADGEELEALADSGTDLSNTELRLTGDEYHCGILWLMDFDNLSIVGNGSTEVYSSDGSDTILYAYNCNNLLLYGLVMGHKLEPEGGCSAGVLYLSDSTGMRVIGCDLYGCGLVGLTVLDAEVGLEYTTVRDCSESALVAGGADVRFDHCTISGNNKSAPELMLFEVGEESSVLLTDCALLDNHSAVKAGEYVWTADYSSYTIETLEGTVFEETNCYEEGNAF